MMKISAENLVGEEWAEWYSLTPMERFRESEKLWETYLSLGGLLDPELAASSRDRRPQVGRIIVFRYHLPKTDRLCASKPVRMLRYSASRLETEAGEKRGRWM